ncbi:hypothetical protein [Dysosmobacter welbionis]|uniref:hypothetical protein n=1 Tax=Dysosmobacter welbionis TaxID=2093857 RepID=UPI00300ED460
MTTPWLSARAADTKFGANGVLTEVFYDDDDGAITITQVNTYVGEISKSVAATGKKDAYVEVITTVDSNGCEARWRFRFREV